MWKEFLWNFREPNFFHTACGKVLKIPKVAVDKKTA